MRFAAWLTLFAALVAGGPRVARAEWPRINKKLVAGKLTVRKAVLMPAQVSYSKTGMKGGESDTSGGAQIGASLYSAVSKELAVRGVEVLPNQWSQTRDDAARFAVADLQAKYDNVAVQMRKKPGGVAKGQYTLGDRVAKFEPGAAADALVFIRGAGRSYTKSRTAFAVATLNVTALVAQFRGEVSVVDAKSGELLAFIRFGNNSAAPEDAEDRFRQSLRSVMRDVPFPVPAPKSDSPVGRTAGLP